MRDRSTRDQFLVLNFYVRSKAIGLYTFKSSYAVYKTQESKAYWRRVSGTKRGRRGERGEGKRGEGGKERRKRHVKAGEYERGHGDGGKSIRWIRGHCQKLDCVAVISQRSRASFG